MGELELSCIASWKQHLPDWELKLWTEENFDVHFCEYSSQAYEAKKWAFVADAARFEILRLHGGVYLDTDVEVLKNFEELITDRAVFAAEKDGEPGMSAPEVAPGLFMAAPAGHSIITDAANYYKSAQFIRPDGTQDRTTCVTVFSALLEKHGLRKAAGIQQLPDGVVYSPEYFNPMEYQTGALHLTPHTYAIHHYAGSWLTANELFLVKLRKTLTQKGVPLVVSQIIAALARLVMFRDLRWAHTKVKMALEKVIRQKK